MSSKKKETYTTLEVIGSRLSYGSSLCFRASRICIWAQRGGAIVTSYKVFGQTLYTHTAQFPLGLRVNDASRSLGKAMLDSQTQEKIQKLCKNLDDKSKARVHTLLNRCKEAYTQDKEIYTDITLEESEELEQIGQRFYGDIAQLGYKPYRYGHYLLPTDFFEISVLWHKHSLDELEASTLAKMKNKDIIDVGACVGDSALVFQKYTDRHIYAFEPTNENYAFLLQTIELNNTTRIIPIKKALGASASKGQISVHGGASSLVFDNRTASHDVEIITLDSFVRERNIQVGFIKVDIEGFEQEFLKGARQTIAEQKPAMLISIYHQASDFFDIKPMIESWNLGYTFKIVKATDLSLSDEIALFCEVRE